MDGRSKNIDDPWVLPSGASLRYPGDYDGPPEEIINCRCMEIIDLKSV
jgi:hypothetical protein